MESLNQLLGDKNFDPPEDIEKLKRYIRDFYHEEVEIMISNNRLIIQLPSASLAGAIRMNLPAIKRELKIEKQISLMVR